MVKEGKRSFQKLSRGMISRNKRFCHWVHAYVDVDDVHLMMIGAAGVGKTAYFYTLTWNMLVLQVLVSLRQIQREIYIEIMEQ